MITSFDSINFTWLYYFSKREIGERCLTKFNFTEEKQGDVKILLSNDSPYLEHGKHLNVTEIAYNFFTVSVYIQESTPGQEDPEGHPCTLWSSSHTTFSSDLSREPCHGCWRRYSRSRRAGPPDAEAGWQALQNPANLKCFKSKTWRP